MCGDIVMSAETKIEFYVNLTGTPRVVWKLVEVNERWYEEALDTKDQDEDGELTVGVTIETVTELIDLLSAIKALETFDRLRRVYVGCSILKDNIRAQVSLGTQKPYLTGDTQIHKGGQNADIRQAWELLGRALGI